MCNLHAPNERVLFVASCAARWSRWCAFVREYAADFRAGQRVVTAHRRPRSRTPNSRSTKRQVHLPQRLTVLAIVTIAVWAARLPDPGGPVRPRRRRRARSQGTYHRVDSGRSPSSTGSTTSSCPRSTASTASRTRRPAWSRPTTAGDLYGSAGVFLFVLAIGAFITVVFATGALDRGIGRLAAPAARPGRAADRGRHGASSPCSARSRASPRRRSGFYGLIVPLMLALGYDRMVAVGAIILGAGVGVLCSTVNPFATGVASSAADISLGDGIVLRFVMWVVLTAVTVALRHPVRAARADGPRPVAGRVPARGPRAGAAEAPGEVPRADRPAQGGAGRRSALVFAFMIFSVVPWSSALTGEADATPYGFELGWSFPQLAALFLVAAVLVGLVARMGEQKLSATISPGRGRLHLARRWSSCWPAASP